MPKIADRNNRHTDTASAAVSLDASLARVKTRPHTNQNSDSFTMQKPELPFWQTKSLQEMSKKEWESLCDGCGRCCLHKLEDEDTQEIFYTTVACRLLDLDSCRCKHYPERKLHVEDCLMLSPTNLDDLPWLPETCAYRRLASGKSLPSWHPLITGSSQSVHRAQISIRDFAISEDDVEDLHRYVIPSL